MKIPEEAEFKRIFERARHALGRALEIRLDESEYNTKNIFVSDVQWTIDIDGNQSWFIYISGVTPDAYALQRFVGDDLRKSIERNAEIEIHTE